MVAAPDLGSGVVRRGGSSPFVRTLRGLRPLHFNMHDAIYFSPDCIRNLHKAMIVSFLRS